MMMTSYEPAVTASVAGRPSARSAPRARGGIRAEQLGGRERDDLGPRAGRPLRAVGARGPLLSGSAVGGIGTAAVVLVGHALAALATLATIAARAARPARTPGTARFDQPGEERILGRNDDVEAAAAPAASPRAAIAPATTRPSGLGRAASLAGGAVAAILPRCARAAPTAARLDPEPIGGRDGIAVGEHIVRARVAHFHGCHDQLVVEGRPHNGEPHRHARSVATGLRRAARLPAELEAVSHAAALGRDDDRLLHRR